MNLLDKFHNWRRKLRWDRQYKKGRWESLRGEKEAIRYQKIAAFIARYAKESPRVLDIGCGDGLLTERMPAESYSSFLGVDFSRESIKIASGKHLPKAEFLAADAVKFQPKQDFDVIVFNEAFYYIHETEKQNVLNRMLKNLTQDGIIITSIYREGHGCWKYFKEDKRLIELDFTTVKTDEDLRYWKIGVYKKN